MNNSTAKAKPKMTVKNGVVYGDALSAQEKKRIVMQKKKDRKAKKVRKSAQQTIPYVEMCRDGICKVNSRLYTKSIAFEDINYQLAQNEDKTAIFENWCDFLNYFDSSIFVQLSFINQKASLNEFRKRINIPAQEDAFNDIRSEYSGKLGHIFKERTERAKGNETLLAVTISNGVQRRDEIDLKDNSSDDKSNYKCVYIGDIAYNTMRMWQGASGVSPYNGIVSPAYTIVTPIRPDLHNMTFWAYYFKYSPLVQTFQKYSQGLTSDTWNLKFPQFSEIAVTMPPISEQDKIAECLSVFDEHCKCEDEKLQALLQVRTSLLQQLFI